MTQKQLDQGKTAYLQGMSIDDNPYDPEEEPLRYESWQQGFQSSENELDDNEDYSELDFEDDDFRSFE